MRGHGTCKAVPGEGGQVVFSLSGEETEGKGAGATEMSSLCDREHTGVPDRVKNREKLGEG